MDIVLYIDPDASQACALECLDSVSRTVDITKHSVWVVYEDKLPYAIDLFVTERTAFIGWNTIKRPKHAQIDISHLSCMKHDVIAHIEARFVFRHPFWADALAGVLWQHRPHDSTLMVVGLITEPIAHVNHWNLTMAQYAPSRQTALYWTREDFDVRIAAWRRDVIPSNSFSPEDILRRMDRQKRSVAVLPAVEIDAWPW